MRMSAEQYRRGFVRWSTAGPSTLSTATGPDDASVLPYSAPLTEPSGSIVESPPGAHRDVRLNPDGPAALGKRWRVVWDRLFDDDIDALVVDPANSVAQVVSGIPDIGRFRRIVVAVPYLGWLEDMVFREDDLLVRLVKQGPPLPPTPFPTPSVGPPPNQWGDFQVDRFVEIVAPDRGDRALSVLGLLALAVGDAAVGDIVVSDTREFDPGSGGTAYAVDLLGRGSWFPSAVGLTLRLPVLLSNERLDAFDRSMSVLTMRGQVPDKLALALRWYERGLPSFSPVERLLANFVEIEALATSISDASRFQSPLADLLGDGRIVTLLEPMVERHGRDNVDRLLKRLVDKRPSMLDRFDFVAGEIGLSADSGERFRSVKSARDSVMHGSGKRVDDEVATAANVLLDEVLHAAVEWVFRKLVAHAEQASSATPT